MYSKRGIGSSPLFSLEFILQNVEKDIRQDHLVFLAAWHTAMQWLFIGSANHNVQSGNFDWIGLWLVECIKIWWNGKLKKLNDLGSRVDDNRASAKIALQKLIDVLKGSMETDRCTPAVTKIP